MAPKIIVKPRIIKADNSTISPSVNTSLDSRLTILEGELLQTDTYDTGWVANSDWTNAQLNITHNLDTNIRDLIIKFYISTDGTDNNTYEVNYISDVSFGNVGFSVEQTSSNVLYIQTGANGLWELTGTGTVNLVNNESYYYRVKIYKPNSVSFLQTSQVLNNIINRQFITTGASDTDIDLDTLDNGNYFYKKIDSGIGDVTFSGVTRSTIDGTALTNWSIGTQYSYLQIAISGNDTYMIDRSPIL